MLPLKVDAIGYRYSPAELSTLMALLGYEKIACLPKLGYPDQETFRKGFNSLEGKDIVSNVGGHILVDSVHTLLMRNLCQCARFLSISSDDSAVSLCACRDMFLLTKTENGGLTLYAAPDLDAAEAYFYEAFHAFPDHSAAWIFREGHLTTLRMPLCGAPRERIRPELLRELAAAQSGET